MCPNLNQLWWSRKGADWALWGTALSCGRAGILSWFESEMSLIVLWLYLGSLCRFQEAGLAGGSRLPVAGLWRFCLFLCFLVHCHWRPTLSCFCHRVWRSPFTHSHVFSAGIDRIYETISPNTGFFPWAFSVKCFTRVMRKATNTDAWLASLPGEGVWEVPRRKEKNRQQEQVF